MVSGAAQPGQLRAEDPRSRHEQGQANRPTPPAPRMKFGGNVTRNSGVSSVTIDLNSATQTTMMRNGSVRYSRLAEACMRKTLVFLALSIKFAGGPIRSSPGTWW